MVSAPLECNSSTDAIIGATERNEPYGAPFTFVAYVRRHCLVDGEFTTEASAERGEFKVAAQIPSRLPRYLTRNLTTSIRNATGVPGFNFNCSDSGEPILDIGDGQYKHNIAVRVRDGLSYEVIPPNAPVSDAILARPKISSLSFGRTLPADTWTFVAVTHEVSADPTLGVARLYLDGEKVAEGTMPTPLIARRRYARLCKSNFVGDPNFNGAIRDVYWYNRVLNRRELADLRRAKHAPADYNFARYRSWLYPAADRHPEFIKEKRNKTLTGRSLLMWGLGNNGQLGIGGYRARGRSNIITSPVLVEPLRSSELVDVSCGGQHAIALTAMPNEVFAWGDGAKGALGLGDKISKVYPTRNVMLRRRNDTEWAEKGYFEYGDITEGRLPPVDDRGEVTFIKSVHAGGFHSLAVDSSVRAEIAPRSRRDRAEIAPRCALAECLRRATAGRGAGTRRVSSRARWRSHRSPSDCSRSCLAGSPPPR